MRRLRRRIRRLTLRFLLSATVHFRRLQVRFRAQVTRLRFLPWILIPTLLGAAIGGLVYIHQDLWQKTGEALADKGILPQLEIAVGAAVLGIIGIVFSLSIFSIQQVAERGTPFTLREYAQDWVFRIVYWTLALFALLAMLSALQKNETGLYRICFNLGILAGSVLLLKVYFGRVIKFVDPHFTVTKISKRASKFLRQIQIVEGAVRAEVRYQRAKK
ncbi:MAG: hypothetical protein M1453_05545 [Acidobacteria bacterium]|nr:hypothetical protein [Acidobacteriota bacterium]MCL5287441.1 hypothetical protein [Acidobacteriota bacterium]